MRLSFSLRFFGLFLSILFVEIYIGLFVRDNIIRPHVGDALVVVLIYAFICTFVQANRRVILFSTITFAYLVEIGQLFHLVHRLGLENYTLAKIMIGSTFDVHDLIAYSVGGLIIFLWQ